MCACYLVPNLTFWHRLQAAVAIRQRGSMHATCVLCSPTEASISGCMAMPPSAVCDANMDRQSAHRKACVSANRLQGAHGRRGYMLLMHRCTYPKTSDLDAHFQHFPETPLIQCYIPSVHPQMLSESITNSSKKVVLYISPLTAVLRLLSKDSNISSNG